MSEDILHEVQRTNPQADFSQMIYNEALIDLQDIVIHISGNDLHHYGFPPVASVRTNILIQRELNYDVQV